MGPQSKGTNSKGFVFSLLQNSDFCHCNILVILMVLCIIACKYNNVVIYSWLLSLFSSQFLKNRKYNPTVLLQDIMTSLFPSQLAERKQVHDAEMAELSK